MPENGLSAGQTPQKCAGNRQQSHRLVCAGGWAAGACARDAVVFLKASPVLYKQKPPWGQAHPTTATQGGGPRVSRSSHGCGHTVCALLRDSAVPHVCFFFVTEVPPSVHQAVMGQTGPVSVVG